MTIERSARAIISKGLGARAHQALMEFYEEESGQDQVEFALVAALLSLSAIATLKGLAGTVLSLWQGLATGFSGAV